MQNTPKSQELTKAINEYSISLIKYYFEIIKMEPNDYKLLDDKIRSFLIKYHIHHQPACKERLYLLRNELGRVLNNVKFKSEKMLLQLFTTLESPY